MFLADVQNDTNCQDAGAVAVVSRIAAKILAAATKEQKKTQIYRRILTDELSNLI